MDQGITQIIRIICTTMAILFASGLGYAQTAEQRGTAEWRSNFALTTTLEGLNRQAIVGYTGSCYRPSVIIGPAIRLNRAVVEETDAAARLRQLFATDRRFGLIEEREGIFTILQTGMAQDVLNLPLKKVQFSPEQQYDYRLAALALLHTPEVGAYMAAHRSQPENSWGGFVTGPAPDRPHLPETIENTTVSGVIRTILKSFPLDAHLAIYRECTTAAGQRTIGINIR